MAIRCSYPAWFHFQSEEKTRPVKTILQDYCTRLFFVDLNAGFVRECNIKTVTLITNVKNGRIIKMKIVKIIKGINNVRYPRARACLTLTLLLFYSSESYMAWTAYMGSTLMFPIFGSCTNGSIFKKKEQRLKSSRGGLDR